MAASPARQIGMRSIRTHELLPAAIVAAQWLAGSGHGAWLAIASPTTTTNSPSIRTQSYPPAKLCPFARCAVKRSRPWPLLQSGPIPSSLRAFRCAIFSLTTLGRSTARIQSAPALALAMG